MKNIVHVIFLAKVLVLLYSCEDVQKKEGNEAVGPEGWLKGSANEKFVTVARQLRGFDVTMVEVGYRYQELYWAGIDENWDYARYQIEKMETTLKDGFARRPKREELGTHFLN
jgi:hypothetical protein